MANNIKLGELYKYFFKFNANLGPGNYSIAVAAHAHKTHIGKNYDWRDLALIFEVVNVGEDNFIGSSWLPPQLIMVINE